VIEADDFCTFFIGRTPVDGVVPAGDGSEG